jgi:hypothetical protein
MIAIDDLLARLDGVVGRHPQFSARCPAHDDKAPSLSIKDAGDRILLHCFAACYPESILDALGLRWADVCSSDRWQHAKVAMGAHVRWELDREAVKRKLRLGFDPDQERMVLKIVAADIRAGKSISAEDKARFALAEERLAALEEVAA